MKISIALSALVALVLLAVVAAPAASVDAAHTIRPGQGIGPVDIGMTLQDANKAWGPPLSTQTLESGGTAYNWYDPDTLRTGGLSIFINPTGTIDTVAVFNDGTYQTLEGLRTATIENAKRKSFGSFGNQVRALLGAPDKVVEGTYLLTWAYRRGLIINMDRTDTGANLYVISIGVRKAW